jgi:hypothetical protein
VKFLTSFSLLPSPFSFSLLLLLFLPLMYLVGMKPAPLIQPLIALWLNKPLILLSVRKCHDNSMKYNQNDENRNKNLKKISKKSQKNLKKISKKSQKISKNLKKSQKISKNLKKSQNKNFQPDMNSN